MLCKPSILVVHFLPSVFSPLKEAQKVGERGMMSSVQYHLFALGKLFCLAFLFFSVSTEECDRLLEFLLALFLLLRQKWIRIWYLVNVEMEVSSISSCFYSMFRLTGAKANVST